MSHSPTDTILDYIKAAQAESRFVTKGDREVRLTKKQLLVIISALDNHMGDLSQKDFPEFTGEMNTAQEAWGWAWGEIRKREKETEDSNA